MSEEITKKFEVVLDKPQISEILEKGKFKPSEEFLKDDDTMNSRNSHPHPIREGYVNHRDSCGAWILIFGICIECKEQIYYKRISSSVLWFMGLPLQFVDVSGEIVREMELN